MTNTTIKVGEVICLASGVYEGYSKKGPFVAMSGKRLPNTSCTSPFWCGVSILAKVSAL